MKFYLKYEEGDIMQTTIRGVVVSKILG